MNPYLRENPMIEDKEFTFPDEKLNEEEIKFHKCESFSIESNLKNSNEFESEENLMNMLKREGGEEGGGNNKEIDLQKEFEPLQNFENSSKDFLKTIEDSIDVDLQYEELKKYFLNILDNQILKEVLDELNVHSMINKFFHENIQFKDDLTITTESNHNHNHICSFDYTNGVNMNLTLNSIGTDKDKSSTKFNNKSKINNLKFFQNNVEVEKEQDEQSEEENEKYMWDVQDAQDDLLKKKRKKYIRNCKTITECPHTDQKHYAKNKCYNCYHREGRDKKAWACVHTDKPLYARGVCHKCYQNDIMKIKKKTKQNFEKSN